MIIFSGSSHPVLAKKIAELSQSAIGECEITTFANGEKNVLVKTDAGGQDVVIVQSFAQQVDSQIIELALMVDALERMGAKSVSVVIPWMGYSLQDKVFQEGQPLSARVIADIISSGYVQKVFLIDLHNPSIIGFFSVPTQHLRAIPMFIQYAKDTCDLSNTIVVSPDFGGLKQSRVFAEAVGVDLVNVNKHRDLRTGEVSVVSLSGDVNGKICLVYDDVINTGGTVVEVAKMLKEQGAKEVHFLVTHGLFAGEGLQKMNDEAIDSVVITNSVYHADFPEKIKVLSVAEMIVKALQ